MISCAIFRSRSTYYQLCTTLSPTCPENILKTSVRLRGITTLASRTHPEDVRLAQGVLTDVRNLYSPERTDQGGRDRPRTAASRKRRVLRVYRHPNGRLSIPKRPCINTQTAVYQYPNVRSAVWVLINGRLGIDKRPFGYW